MATGTPKYRYKVFDYLNIGTAGTPDYVYFDTAESVDENPNAQLTEKHYTSDKSKTVMTSSYQTQFAFAMDIYSDNPVSDYIRKIGEEQQIGVETDYVRVDLGQKIEGDDIEPNTFYARKFRVSFEVSSIAGAGGEIMTVSGNMNTLGDVVVGSFNTETKEFTPAA